MAAARHRRGSRRPRKTGLGATIRARAARARSTRSVTASEPSERRRGRARAENVMAGYGIREWPAGERPRQRLHSQGCPALSSRELLAILIGSGREGVSALDVAGALLRWTDGSLRRLAAATPAELKVVDGIGPATAARVSAALELGRRLAREGPVELGRIRGPRDVYERCAPSMRDLSQEEFRTLLLNTQHAVL